MFFAEVLPLEVPLSYARDRLDAHPDLERALADASVAAFADGLGSLPILGTAGGLQAVPITVRTLPPYRRAGTSVVLLRWLGKDVAGGADSILDANLELQPDHDTFGTKLALLGSFQVPAALEFDDTSALLHKQALATTVRSLLIRTAEIVTPWHHQQA